MGLGTRNSKIVLILKNVEVDIDGTDIGDFRKGAIILGQSHIVHEEANVDVITWVQDTGDKAADIGIDKKADLVFPVPDGIILNRTAYSTVSLDVVREDDRNIRENDRINCRKNVVVKVQGDIKIYLDTVRRICGINFQGRF